MIQKKSWIHCIIENISGQPIMNAEIDKEENSDINHRARHDRKLTKDWIKRPFKVDPIPQVVDFQATTRPTKGGGAKVTIPTFIAQSLVRPEIVHQLDKEVGYYRAHKGKGKRKRTSPQQPKPIEELVQALPQQAEENVQWSKNVEATQTKDNPQVPPLDQGRGRVETKVQEEYPPTQEVQGSPGAPKRRKIKTLVKRRQKVIRKVIHFQSVLEVILEEGEEEDDENEEDNLSLNKRTHLSRARELE